MERICPGKPGGRFLQRILILVLILCAAMFLAGCLETYPSGGPEPVQTQTRQEQPGQGEVTLTAAPTPVNPAVELAGSPWGYISRSFGLSPYTAPPVYHITHIDSSAKRDSSGKVYVQGRIKNEGPGFLDYLHITYRLMDANGNILGNVEASIEYFPPGKIWRYNTTSFPGDNYQNYELARVIAQ